jgi:hypothetical protein
MTWLRVARGTGAVLDRGQIGGGDKPRAAPADTVLVLPGSEAQLRTLDEVAHTEAQAKAAALLGDGVVVGSALVRAAGRSVQEAIALTAALRAAIDEV